MTCPGPHTEPGSTTLRARISQPEMPTASASRSSTPSIANCAWLAPKPRNAPHTGLFVRAAIDSTSMAGSTYGPLACPAERSNTFMPTDAYGPESPTIRARSAVSRPSASQPAQYSMRMGWRFGWISSDSSRESVHLTGRSRSHAASAVWAWLAMSSLPPNAPPFATSSTVTLPASMPSTDAIWSRSSHTPWPPDHTCRPSVPSGSFTGATTVDSGSRYACSIRCVWNTSCMTCALDASAASTSPRT